MYVPDYYREDDTAVMHALMRQAPFATLVTTTNDGLMGTHLPTVLQSAPAPFGTIEAHIARPNSQWKTYRPDEDALLIFAGPNHYVRPAWYPSKTLEGKAVPTWNYAAVHAYGRVEIIKDQIWLKQHVAELTQQQERTSKEPWAISDAPEDYIQMMLRGIVGIRMVITRLDGKWKMSQNRSNDDRAGVVNGLTTEDDANASAVAKLIPLDEN